MLSVVIVICVALLIWIGLGEPRRSGRSHPDLASERTRRSFPFRASAGSPETEPRIDPPLVDPSRGRLGRTPGDGSRA